MTTKQMDTASSFQYVVDNVPGWKSELTALSLHATNKYEEFLAEYRRVMHQVKQKRQKSDSIASIHSEENVPKEGVESPRLSDFVEINPMEAGNRYIYAQAQKKRRAGTSLRSGAADNRNVRSKRNVIIYYDAHIQAELDKLVRGFGAARNNLRKGKNAYTVSKGFSLPTLSRRYDISDRLTVNGLGKPYQHPTKAQSDTMVVSASNSLSVEASFASIDKELEVIQSLCETAAHQAIRDGDCSNELKDAIVKLDIIQASALLVLDVVKVEMQSISDENKTASSNHDDNISTQSTLYEKTSSEALTKAYSLTPIDVPKRPPIATISSAPQPLAVDAIEVDDDEDDDGSSLDLPLNFATYRTANRRLAS